MSKTHLANYPQLPPEMQAATGGGTSSGATTSGAAVYAGEHAQAPPPPTYDQATGTVTSGTSLIAGHTAGSAIGQPQMSMPYQPQHQQYISTSTCVYTQPQQSMPSQQARNIPITTQQPVVIIHQQMLPLGPEPVYITCPNCHIQKLTRIEYEPSTRTHLMAALLCVLGLWCCVCLPYCAGSCMNANHYCGNCNKFLGTYGAGL